MKEVDEWKLGYADHLRVLMNKHRELVWRLTNPPGFYTPEVMEEFNTQLHEVNKDINAAIPDDAYPIIMFKDGKGTTNEL